jgi:hypothetical protein
MFKCFSFIFLLFVTSTIVGQEVTASQKIPSSVMPGTDFIIETTINRGNVNGFMRFFQELPEGFIPTDIESKGGSFTYSDNGAKIVWLATPSETTFTVSYKVTVSASMSGQKTLPGKISYINNNERKIFELEPKTIMIGNGVAIAEKKEIPKTTPPPTTAPIVAKTPPPVIPPPVAVKKELPPPVAIQENPTFSKVPTSALPTATGKTYKVQIGAYAAKPKVDGVPEISTLVLDNGITKYFSGKFSLYEDAVKRKKEMQDKGFQGAFIVAFENGQIIK